MQNSNPQIRMRIVFHSSASYTIYLPQRRSLNRFCLLDSGHGIEDDLLGQESAFDVFTDDTFFIDEHADR
jgi:hypothetical protein